MEASKMESVTTEPFVTVRQGVRTRVTPKISLTLVSIILGLFFVAAPSAAQQRRQDMKREPAPKLDTEANRLRGQFADATREYKGSLEKLAALYEEDAKRMEARVAKMKELCSQGLITRREIGPAEQAAALARERLAGLQAQLKSAEVQLAEALVEVEAEESAPKLMPGLPRRSGNGIVHTTAYLRYSGGRTWALSEVGAIKQFFVMRFGRPLPIHVFGQSPLHDRWRYDHRNAMDIGLNPNSPEGQALMEYLRANGIPFTAFQFAIPGVATGPHIHVGLPSHRIGSTWLAANPTNTSRQ